MATENKQEPAQEARNASPDGEFIRDTNYIEDRIVPGSVSQQSRKMAHSTGHKKLAAIAWR